MARFTKRVWAREIDFLEDLEVATDSLIVSIQEFDKLRTFVVRYDDEINRVNLDNFIVSIGIDGQNYQLVERAPYYQPRRFTNRGRSTHTERFMKLTFRRANP